MKIFVCAKQVPDTTSKVYVKPDGTLDRAKMRTVTNPDDLAATEAALVLKERFGATVTVVTMGPPRAEEMLYELLAMGADDAVLVTGRSFAGSDTYATSRILAAAIRTVGFGPSDL
ncbi:MAG: electron transfer flavoprotein subunit beta, partial [Firmicutes bacterium]|nr:electron transfer flavoprotein subunit beta [Bacillota bacterium]